MPTSRARERRAATASAIGDRPAIRGMADGAKRTRRRTIGAVTPTATTAHALARMALDSRKARPSIGAGRDPAGALGPCSARPGGGRLAHQRVDQAALLIGLGVPLHAEHELA